jgi:hypothetical protein
MGAYFGGLIVLGRATSPLRERAARILRLDRIPTFHQTMRVATTFTLVCVGWVFFRAPDLSDAILVLSRIPSGLTQITDVGSWRTALGSLGPNRWHLVQIAASIGLLVAVERVRKGSEALHPLATRSSAMRRAVVYALLFWILFFGHFGGQPFIYFQF